MVALAARARELASIQLEEALPRRWSHVQAVARKARLVGSVLLDASDAQILIAAAWLHDIGYSAGLVQTGLHSLDGARWLRRKGIDERVTSLVAHHSCAHLEAMERGLADDLTAEFLREESVVADTLWYADMTTGPNGEDFELTIRLGEICARYGPGDAVTRFIVRAEPEIVAAVQRTEERLKAVAQPM